MALASSIENQTRGNGGNHVGKETPSERRPATRKKWVAKVRHLTFPDVKRHLRPPSNNRSRIMPEEKRDWVIGEGDPFARTPIERWDAFPDTDVTTDIVYLRKRAEGDPPGDDGWVETKKVSAKDKWGSSEEVDINSRYVDNPDCVLGKHSAAGSMYRGGEYTLKGDPSIPVVPTLNREMREMAKDLGPDALRPQRTVPYERPEDFSKARRKRRPERLVLEDGQLRLSDGTSSHKPDLPAEEIQRTTALKRLRDTARKLVTKEAEDGDNDEVERTREALRQQYDNYVADQNGEAINTSTNRKLLVAGADSSLDDQSFDVTNLRR